jgi:Carboxypeptidase regulatory-like domain
MTRTTTKRLVTIACLLLCSVTTAPVSTAQERGPAGTVTLSRIEYDRLLDLAGKQPRPPDRAPLAAALTQADIRVRVAAGTARATMTVDGEVFQTGPVKVPLISNATLLDARAGERPLPLVAEGNSHVAVVTGPATFSATLEWGSAVTTTPGRGSFVLPVPPSGSATAVFDVPGEQSDLRVSPGLVMRRTSAGGRTVIEATLDPGSATQVWWSARETGPAVVARDTRLLADVKTLVTIGLADLRLLSLVDLTIVQGEPTQVEVRIPAGYELAGATGGSLERTEQQGDRVVLFMSAPARRRHQFLLNLERPASGSASKVETTFPTVPAAQREMGEVAVEGIGTIELSTTDVPGLRRMDVREVDAALSSAARQSLLAAFRYQRSPSGVPTLALGVTRFPDAAVLAAIAERAVATTLVTSEGRALTEVSLWLRNRAQPFMKVELPPGATMLSVEVAGSPAKPAEGTDGMRVPLLRPGLRPTGPYTVSFVYLHAGTAFAKKGEMQMTLPKMDVPVSVVEWELFLPDRYRADRFNGTAIAAHLVEAESFDVASAPVDRVDVPAGSGGGGLRRGSVAEMAQSGGAVNGQILGRVVDKAGAAIPGATIVAQIGGHQSAATTDADGWYVMSNLPSGSMLISSQLTGFSTAKRSLVYDQRPRQIDFRMEVGGVTETVTVTAEAPLIDTNSSTVTHTFQSSQQSNRARDEARRNAQLEAPSMNVQNLQRRAAGVLPVRIDVPRAGRSHRFLKPLVIDEETVVSFRYKRK